jgi:hypothetical protein
VLNAVQEWLPEGSEEAKQVVAIQTFAAQAHTNMEDVDKTVRELRESAVKALTEMGLQDEVNKVQKDITLKLATLREKHQATEKSRVTALRVISAIIGITVAWIIQINTFEILSILFPENLITSLNTTIGHIGGIVATGLAASAGSSFWHDMLGRVRNLKNISEQAEKVISGEAGAGGGGPVG